MKRTDYEKHQRELRKSEKKAEVIKRKTHTGTSGNLTKMVGEYIDNLFALFRYDTEEIFNINSDINILELLENMKNDLPEKQWDNVLKKGVRKTKIKQKDRAFDELKQMLGV